MSAEDPEEFYKRLKEQLDQSTIWPSDYLYKFIVHSKTETVIKIHDIFDNMGAVIESKLSKKGKYTSISITVNLENSEAVIKKYKEVGELDGVISL
jgi:putative lipoic acid-binding regulatory protein